MSNSNVQALEKISSEVVESQFKIILSSQCIKAQAFLVHKLRKQSEQSKQICNFISNDNFKLENEIRLGELEIKSFLSALETIKSANVELKKDLLLSKEEKNDLTERVNNGIKKYEEIWTKSKKKYDNIPLIKEKLQLKSIVITTENNINSLGNEIQCLKENLHTRNNELINLDRKNIIKLAEYMIQERPKLLQCVREKRDEISTLMREINELQNDQGVNESLNPSSAPNVDTEASETRTQCVKDNWTDISINNNENNEPMLLPKLQLQNIDLDILTDKLEQIRKADKKSFIKNVDSVSLIQNNTNTASSNIKISVNEDKNKETYQTTNYSEKKLIHILEDIQINKNDTFNILSKLNTKELHDVNTIRADLGLNKTQQSQEKIDDLVSMDDDEVIEEVDLTLKDPSHIVVPPKQFLDSSQGGGPMEVANTPQENFKKERKVTFDTASVQDIDTNNINNINKSQDTTNSQPSTTRDGTYKELKETMYTKHNIQLSPQFSYSENHKTTAYTPSVTSKFFKENNTSTKTENVDANMETDSVKGPEHTLDVFEIKQVRDSSVAGLLFTHGPKGLPEIDVSMNSTCIEDSYEFTHCIDSTLLLSPKADVITAPNDKNTEILSQEVPHFLSGFRKVGFSFFGNSSSENKADSNNKNQNTDFNFKFGSTEKKSRGGLFNMFH